MPENETPDDADSAHEHESVQSHDVDTDSVKGDRERQTPSEGTEAPPATPVAPDPETPPSGP